MSDLGPVGVVLRGYYAMPLGLLYPYLRPGGLPARALILSELHQTPACDAGAYRSIAGQVRHEGVPSVSVSVWGWNSRQLRARTETAADGSWTLAVGPGQYGITYHVAGYQPLTHGPYQF